MPNWCKNRVDISGEPEDVKKFMELVGKQFDFQKIIPMPKELEDTTSPVRTQEERANMTPGRQRELLDKYGWHWEGVVQAYENADRPDPDNKKKRLSWGLTIDDAILARRLICMNQWTPKKGVQIWQPPRKE